MLEFVTDSIDTNFDVSFNFFFFVSISFDERFKYMYTRINLRRVTIGGYVRNDSGERENCNTKRKVLRFSFPLEFAHTHLR